MDKDLQSRYLYDAIIMFRKERTKNIRTSHPERCQGLDAAPLPQHEKLFYRSLAHKVIQM